MLRPLLPRQAVAPRDPFGQRGRQRLEGWAASRTKRHALSEDAFLGYCSSKAQRARDLTEPQFVEVPASVGSIARCASPTFPRDCTSEAPLARTYRQLHPTSAAPSSASSRPACRWANRDPARPPPVHHLSRAGPEPLPRRGPGFCGYFPLTAQDLARRPGSWRPTTAYGSMWPSGSGRLVAAAFRMDAHHLIPGPYTRSVSTPRGTSPAPAPFVWHIWKDGQYIPTELVS